MSSDFSAYPDNVRVVSSISEMIEERFTPEQNVLLMRRDLRGDYNAVARAIMARAGVKKRLGFSNGVSKLYTPYEQKEFGKRELRQFFSWTKPLEIDDGCLEALEQIRSDIQDLSAHKFKSELRVQVSNSQGRLHVDGNGNRFVHSRILVNYSGAPTYGAHPSDVIDSSSSDIKMRPGAELFPMKLGDIWRQAAVISPDNTVPFVHTEPADNMQPRLVLVADPYGNLHR